jgi:hypothetical protein
VVSVPPELLRQKLLGKVERKLDKQLEKAWAQRLLIIPVDPGLSMIFWGFCYQKSTISWG